MARCKWVVTSGGSRYSAEASRSAALKTAVSFLGATKSGAHVYVTKECPEAHCYRDGRRVRCKREKG